MYTLEEKTNGSMSTGNPYVNGNCRHCVNAEHNIQLEIHELFEVQLSANVFDYVHDINEHQMAQRDGVRQCLRTCFSFVFFSVFSGSR